MNTVNLRRIFQSKFDYQTFCNDIVHSIFGCNDIIKRPDQIKVTTEGDKCYFIGRMTDAEGRELGFFYTQMAPGGDVRRKRVGLRKLIAPYVRYEVDAAIAVFDDGTRWRLSYICDMNEGATSPKRFSYVLGDADGQYNTPTHRLGDLSGKLRTLRHFRCFFSRNPQQRVLRKVPYPLRPHCGRVDTSRQVWCSLSRLCEETDGTHRLSAFPAKERLALWRHQLHAQHFQPKHPQERLFGKRA